MPEDHAFYDNKRDDSPQASKSATESRLKSNVDESQLRGSKCAIDEHRETWGTQMDFLLSVVGFAVDLTNVWRFPYMVFKNGGGAYLVAYFFLYIFAGIPLFYMELALGQYFKKGAITTWERICPMFKGIGYSVIVVSLLVGLFYNVIIAWALLFMGHSFQSPLPWSTCNNSWNTESCYSFQDLQLNKTGLVNNTLRSSATEFFYRGALNADEFRNRPDWMNPGSIKWEVAVCLLVTYLIIYFSLWKGIRMTGKVVWVTAGLPYILLSIMLVRGLTLEGADLGIKYFFSTDMAKLAGGELWFDAATQVFFSLGPGFGVLMAFASYNTFHTNVYRYALIASLMNFLASFLSGFVVFSVLGYMATKTGRNVEDVATEGVGLVFEVYPEALATMPASGFFSVAFFLMLFMLGLDSSFGGLEAIVTAISDEVAWVQKHREIFCAILFSCLYTLGLIFCTSGGIYYVEFMNIYAPMFGLLFAVLCESLVVSWMYGRKRWCSNIEDMLDFYPGIFWQFCWAIVAPVFMSFTFVYGIVVFAQMPPIVIDKVLPESLYIFGWILGFASVCVIPAFAVYVVLTSPGKTISEKLKASIRPWKDCQIAQTSGQDKIFTTTADIPVGWEDTPVRFSAQSHSVVM